MYGLAVMEPDGVRDVAVGYVPVVAQPHVLAMPSDGAWITGEVRTWPAAGAARGDGPSGVSRQGLRMLLLAAFFVGAATIATLAIVLAALAR